MQTLSRFSDVILAYALLAAGFAWGQSRQCGSKLSDPEVGECWKSASTQFDRNNCAYQDRQRADDELQRAYKEVLTHFRKNPKAVRAIRKAQRAWLRFRDAHVNATYAEENPAKIQLEYGTMFPECHAKQYTQLTMQRTAQLREMMDGCGVCGHTPPETPIVLP